MAGTTVDNKKRAAVNLINQNNLDIKCLQETHKISTGNFNLIEEETNTFGFISTPTGPLRDYRGVAILIGRKLQQYQIQNSTKKCELSGSVVECLTRDRWAAGSSLTGVTALCP